MEVNFLMTLQNRKPQMPSCGTNFINKIKDILNLYLMLNKKTNSLQIWALSVFFNFFNNKFLLAFFIKLSSFYQVLSTYFCTSPI